MASLECLDCCVADVEESVIWKLVLVIVSLLVGHLRVVLTINNTTENIKFTKEEEDNNQLAFLDILLTRTDDGTINTQVYIVRKRTLTKY
jgi:hypothetical protein